MSSIKRLIIPILLGAVCGLLAVGVKVMLTNHQHNAIADTAPVPSQDDPEPLSIHKPVPAPPFGLAWGETLATVEKVMHAKGFTQNQVPLKRRHYMAIFSAGNAGMDNRKVINIDGEVVYVTMITMYRKGLSSIFVVYARKSSNHDALAQFHRISSKIAATYGPTYEKYYADNGSSTYSNMDKELKLFKANGGTLSDSWYFGLSATEPTSGFVSVSIARRPLREPEVSVLYQNQH